MMLYSRASMVGATSGRPTISKMITVIMAAGRAMKKFTRNLSRISQPCDRVAAMVVSEIMERLSPNMAPPTQAPTIMGTLSPPLSARPTAMGTMALMVPMEVPVAVPIKAEIINTPAARKWTGIKDRPRFTVESRPPMAAATPENAPASR